LFLGFDRHFRDGSTGAAVGGLLRACVAAWKTSEKKEGLRLGQEKQTFNTQEMRNVSCVPMRKSNFTREH